MGFIERLQIIRNFSLKDSKREPQLHITPPTGDHLQWSQRRNRKWVALLGLISHKCSCDEDAIAATPLLLHADRQDFVTVHHQDYRMGKAVAVLR